MYTAATDNETFSLKVWQLEICIKSFYTAEVTAICVFSSRKTNRIERPLNSDDTTIKVYILHSSLVQASRAVIRILMNWKDRPLLSNPTVHCRNFSSNWLPSFCNSLTRRLYRCLARKQCHQCESRWSCAWEARKSSNHICIKYRILSVSRAHKYFIASIRSLLVANFAHKQ